MTRRNPDTGPGNGDISGNPPTSPTSPTSKPLGGSPGLLTSTGGLFGVNGLLLTPVQDTKTGNTYILWMDSNNFNCEDDAEYDFPQEIPPRNAPQDGRNVTCYLIVLKYREIDKAKFTINVTSYQKDTDSFTTYPFIVEIKPKGQPDNRIHTRFIAIQVPGERPQVTLNSKGGSGAYSITSLNLCGSADETPQF